KLVAREQRIKSRSGKEHLLQVFVRPGDLDKTEHAMNSLMASVAWDEARFGLPLDLERFMIVATSDFNMGAMENKGLNIFNTKYVLANPATATDADYAGIESVVGHEYFHNWTGNRITCQDWFQLSLKEGLTVFRDQEFSQDMAGIASARAVKRIEDVRVLRTVQFPEDAGPMAHPVRPDAYVEINNFYTVTIYEKGAEVVRMMQTLLSAPGDEEGKQGFAKGMKLYFERHDGQAVTCDDFAQAIADANPNSPLAQQLTQFKRWYSQAGTPRVQATSVYNSEAKTFTLTLSQSCAATPDQAVKEPFVIPVTVGLLSETGQAFKVQLQGEPAAGNPSKTLVLNAASQTFVFENIDSAPTPSLLRNFSAPVNLDCALSDTQWLTLLAHDPDAFNRWEAGQRLAVQAALRFIRGGGNLQTENVLGNDYIDAMRAVLNHRDLDSAFKELVLTLPSETYISEQLESVDPQRVHAVREAMKLQLATSLQSDWETCYEKNRVLGAYSPDALSSGKRSLNGMALSMLCLAAQHQETTAWPNKALQAFNDAHNMTDRFNALSALVASGHPLAATALAQFHALFKNEDLVIDKWFALQASTPDRGGHILPIVRQLMQHPDFNLRNPNRARSLIFSYCSANPGGFHRADAAGYVFWSERVIELDATNPQVAARLARAMDRWRKLAEPYRQAAKTAIERVAAKSDLSNDVREVVTRALAE
ncbi:MAG: Aminopeptidase, partial [Pseudomonadota bacterium]